MDIDTLKKKLDTFFDISNYGLDMPFSKNLQTIYARSSVDISIYIEKDFLKNFNGLMIRNGANIKKIYGTVFLDRSVLEKIFRKKETDILLFSHHPMEDESGGKGFIPLDKYHLDKMKELHISVYSVHTPLDNHATVSTSMSFINALELKKISTTNDSSSKFHIVIGELEDKMPFKEFITMLKTTLQNEKVNFLKKRDFVKKIAIVPGGGTAIEFIHKAQSLGCDTYLTGEYYNKLIQPFGEEERNKFDNEKDNLSINLIEGSHYSTERLVFVNEIPLVFNDLNLPYEFVEQDEAWY
jgi:putative NIF3 family GTP cyclohydrolase 1 type 2